MPASSSIDDPQHRASLARVLFAPATVALFGVSADPARLTSRPQRLLRRYGFRGQVVPIHPTRDSLGGERVYRSIASVPQRIDHAFIMLPAAAVPQIIEQCAAAGVAAATIFSAGFAETGELGRRRQHAMLEAARKSGLRLIGPNCMGIVNVQGRMTLSANAVLEHEVLRAGGLSVISQSGSMLGAIITRAQERGLGFSKLVSVGNECDVAVGELMHLLVDDPDTRAILLFLEAFRDAPVIGSAARRAYAAGKPVIAFKLGRSSTGRAVATTHTGALAGPDEVADAFFAAHGILRVDVFEALFETATLVLGHRPPEGRRVGVLTVSGGGAAMVVDRLGLAGVDVVPPPADVIEALAVRRIRVADAPVTDLPMGRADGGAYAAVLDALLASEHCDVVLAVQGSNATHEPGSVRERVLAATRGGKPLAVFLAPRASEAMRILQTNGVASFRTPEACADAIRAYCEWRAPTPALDIAEATLAALRRSVGGAAHEILDEKAALDRIERLGIPVSPGQVVQHGNERVELPFPVAAKILSPEIAHKTDVQGVVLNIADQAALAAAVEALLVRIGRTCPQARIRGVFVQPMQSGLGEVMVGFRRDRDVGPIVLLGAGGIAAEVIGSHTVRLAPVSVAAATEMIAAVPALAAIRGYRGRPSADIAALAQVIHRLSLLALIDEPRVSEAEINPLIVRADGVVAVDALIRIE